jgi:hypothetical protein
MKTLKWSLGLLVVGVGPLQLYIMFGPADGNPIGLGLLAFFCVPVAILGIGVGLVKLLKDRSSSKGS